MPVRVQLMSDGVGEGQFLTYPNGEEVVIIEHSYSVLNDDGVEIALIPERNVLYAEIDPSKEDV